tara:strand:+ start:110 stop:448 length:339 start_codon:yes stop_codon:yes gene_type:complete
MKRTIDLEVSVIADTHKEESAERKLFLAVIFQALLDATKPKEKKESSISIINRDRAVAWFFCSTGVTCDNFEFVCEQAGLSSSYTRHFAYKVIHSKEIKFVRQKINAVLNSK